MKTRIFVCCVTGFMILLGFSVMSVAEEVDPVVCMWTIDKSAPQTDLTLSLGQHLIVNYDVAVNATGCSEGDRTHVWDIFGETDLIYLGTIWWNPYLVFPQVFHYSKMVGPYNECGEYTVTNYVRLYPQKIDDSWDIKVYVPCQNGCTLTFGYWKTHSMYGPAPYDDAWAYVGEETPFYLSGQTWYQVLWTEPTGGNAYYILAHQYVAAKLNIFNGASSTSAVDEAIVWAENFFSSKTPSTTLSRNARRQALSVADLLDDYNNGGIGPGHCSE